MILLALMFLNFGPRSLRLVLFIVEFQILILCHFVSVKGDLILDVLKLKLDNIMLLKVKLRFFSLLIIFFCTYFSLGFFLRPYWLLYIFCILLPCLINNNNKQ